MILYHGSNTEIDVIDLAKCRPYKDFGKGFYLTTLKDQAWKMARRVVRLYGGMPVVTVFEFYEADLERYGLNYRRFDTPSREWALFVIHNRDRDFQDSGGYEHNPDGRYDVVCGPVANDDLALSFRQFAAGLIDANRLVREMEYKKLTDQYSFHTERAIALLRKLGTDDEQQG